MNKSETSLRFPAPVFVYEIQGVNNTGIVLVFNSLGNPLVHFPDMKIENQAANVWLYRNILDPLLRRWGEHRLSGKDLLRFVNQDVIDVMIEIKRLFKVILNEGLKYTDSALLAVSSVIFGLIRSILTLRDFMFGNRLSIRKKHGKSSKLVDTREFEFELSWCGLTYFPEGTRYFISHVENPSNPEILRPNHVDPGYLRNLFRCSNKIITDNCDEAIKTIRDHVLNSDDLVMSDVGCLVSQSYPAKLNDQENKSGVVLPRKSSM
jgi:hypothetical protein